MNYRETLRYLLGAAFLAGIGYLSILVWKIAEFAPVFLVTFSKGG